MVDKMMYIKTDRESAYLLSIKSNMMNIRNMAIWKWLLTHFLSKPLSENILRLLSIINAKNNGTIQYTTQFCKLFTMNALL